MNFSLRQFRVAANRLKNYDLRSFWGTALVIDCLFTLLLWRYLAEPPFWDDVFALHNQALWLAKHHFAVADLWNTEELYQNGGSFLYPFSIIPWIIALFYALFPPAIVHILARMLSLFFASIAVTAFLFTGKELKLDVSITLLSALAFASYPFFVGQVRRRSGNGNRRCGNARFAGVDPKLQQSCSFLGLFGVPDQTDRSRLILVFCAGNVFAKKTSSFFAQAMDLPCRCVARFIHTASKRAYKCCFLHRTKSGSAPGKNRDPHHIFFHLVFRRTRSYDRRCIAETGKRKKHPNFSRFDMQFLYRLLFAGRDARLPAVRRHIRRHRRRPMEKRYAVCFLLAVLWINLLNLYGKLLPAIPMVNAGNGSYYERSLEYFQVIRTQKRAIREIMPEERTHQYICTWPYAQILTIPEFGYISSPFPHIFTGKVFPKYARAKPLCDLNPQRPIHFLIDFPIHPPFSAELLPHARITVKKFYPVLGSRHGAVCLYDIPGVVEKLRLSNSTRRSLSGVLP